MCTWQFYWLLLSMFSFRQFSLSELTVAELELVVLCQEELWWLAMSLATV